MKIYCTILFCCAMVMCSIAQKDAIENKWLTAEKTSKVEIYKAIDGNFYGKVVWLKEPNLKNGQPKTDQNNKDEKLRHHSIMGLLILKKFKKTATPNVYEEGTVYDPNNGKTYCGTLTIEEKTLKLRGYICGLSWLGRSSIWTLAD